MKKRKLLYYNYIIPALWSQQIVVLLIIISQLQFLSLCKSLAYLLLYFTNLLVLVIAFLLLKSKTASDSLSRDYLHWLFLLLSGEVGIQKNLHKYIILGLCGILRFLLLLFLSKPIHSAQLNKDYLRSTFSVETITEIVFTHLYTYPQFSNSQFQCFPGSTLTEVIFVF